MSNKIFMVGDVHAYLYPLKYQKWMKTLKSYFYDFFIPMLKEKAQEGDICIFLGDLFDNRNLVPIDVFVDVEKIILEISKILPLHIIIGNHDLFSKSSGDYNLPRLFRHIENVSVYQETTQILYNNKKMLIMPWVQKKENQIKLLKEFNDSEYLFCHSDLNGARLHFNSVSNRIPDRNKIAINEFKAFNKVYSGHIHIRQEAKNFTFVGSIYQMDRGDYGDQKGIYVLDTDTGEDEFIPNIHSPIFKKVEIKTEDDFLKLDEVDPSYDYVDLSVSNSLLMSNRKLRRKLEATLESGSFTDVSYINDIIKEPKKTNSGEVDVILEDIDMDFDTVDFNDFDKIITKYINKKKWSSDKIKNGVIEEYKKVTEIFENKDDLTKTI